MKEEEEAGLEQGKAYHVCNKNDMAAEPVLLQGLEPKGSVEYGGGARQRTP